MRSFTLVVVVAGLGLAVALGIRQGFDAASGVILIVLAIVGATAVAIANRAGRGDVSPGHCEECGGVISHAAPFCKHCGARRS